MKLDPEIEGLLPAPQATATAVLRTIETSEDIKLVRHQNIERTKGGLARLGRSGVTTETHQVETADGASLELRLHRPSEDGAGEPRPCQRSRPVADALHSWLTEPRQKLAKADVTAKAIDYS